MELGNKFKSVSTGEIFTVDRVDEKFGQVVVVGENGKSKAYSAVTLKDKRRFVPVEESTKQVEAVKQVEPVEVPTETETVKKVKNKAVKTPVTGVGTDIKDYAVATAKKLGAEVCESNGRFISFKVNNKMFAAIFSYSKKSLTLGVREKAIEGIQAHSIVNHMMNARFKFDKLSDYNMDLITNILASAFEYQSNNKK